MMKIITFIFNKTMRKIILICIFLLIPLICRAEYNPFETVDEARERKAADRYYQRQENPYKQKPLGGYSETLSGSSSSRSSSQRYSSDKDDSFSQKRSSSYESSYHSPFETTDEQRSRHRTESYERKKSNPYGYDEPLGGHSEKLGDTEPYQKKKSSYYGKDKYYYGDEDEE